MLYICLPNFSSKEYVEHIPKILQWHNAWTIDNTLAFFANMFSTLQISIFKNPDGGLKHLFMFDTLQKNWKNKKLKFLSKLEGFSNLSRAKVLWAMEEKRTGLFFWFPNMFPTIFPTPLGAPNVLHLCASLPLTLCLSPVNKILAPQLVPWVKFCLK